MLRRLPVALAMLLRAGTGAAQATGSAAGYGDASDPSAEAGPTCTPLPADGTEVPGAIVSRSENVCFALTATEAMVGQSLDISVGLGSLPDSVLYVLDQRRDGRHPLARNDDAIEGEPAQGSAVRWEVPSPGVFYVAVTAYSAHLRGDFTVSCSPSVDLQVAGAGTPAVDGTFTTGRIDMPTGEFYLGPARTLRLPGTDVFIFRWHRTEWVMADLGAYHDDFSTSRFLYCAPAQAGVDAPPVVGWSTRSQFCSGAGATPAPIVSIAPPVPDGPEDCSTRDGCDAQSSCTMDELKTAILDLNDELRAEDDTVTQLHDTVKVAHDAYVDAARDLIRANETLTSERSELSELESQKAQKSTSPLHPDYPSLHCASSSMSLWAISHTRSARSLSRSSGSRMRRPRKPRQSSLLSTALL